MKHSTTPPAAVARMPKGAKVDNEIIDLVDQSDEPYSILSVGRRRRRRRQEGMEKSGMNHHGLAREVRQKTDPNERLDKEIIDVENTLLRPPNLSPRKKRYSSCVSTTELAVLDIFPDIDIAHLKSLLQLNSHQPDLVIMHLVDNPSYPKEKMKPETRESSLVRLDDNKWSYDFMKPGALSEKDFSTYCVESRSLILNLLPYVNVKAINKLLTKYSHRYAIIHDRLLEAFRSGVQNEPEQFQQVNLAITEGRLRRPEHQKQAIATLIGCDVSQAFVRTSRKRTSPILTNKDLIEETKYVNGKWEEYSRVVLARVERERHKLLAERTGTGLECACCFDTYAAEDMIACRENGHLCCVECLNRYASTKMWSEGNFGIDKATKKPLLDLFCFFGEGDGCKSPFARDALVKALDPKNLKKYDELQCQLVANEVLGDELLACPKCGYRAFLPDGQKIFSCPVEGCRFESCRDCGEAAHIPFRCDEVEKEVVVKGRVTVEEAITQAKIRRCPNSLCKQPFLKSDGCNKVTCACGTKVCYICRKAIKAYTHFCQTPHCKHESCKKCPLWTKAEEDDAIAMREAGLQAASRVATTTAGLDINVDEILAAGTK